MALALRLVRAASLVCAVLVAASATAAPAKPQGMSLIRDAEIEDTIRAYAAPLFDAAGLGAEAVRVHIVDDRRLNAFVAGGLNLFITSGMLAAAEEPGEIAGVIAHEIGHIAGGHLVRTRGAMEDAAAETILGTLLGSGAILAGEGEAGSALIMGAWTMARQNLLRYSQVQEQAADQAAIRLLESTGQSAEGLLAMFRRLERQEFLTVERQDPYLRTHPLTRDRIRFVRNQVETRAAAGAPPPEAEAHAAAHRRMVAKLRGFLDPPKKTLRAYPESDVSVAARYARAIALYRIPVIDRALAVLDGLLADFPDDPWFHELEGQILFENGRIAAAVESYERAVALRGDSALLRFGLARAQIETGDSALAEDAIGHLEAATRLEEGRPSYWHFLGIARGRAGDRARSSLALAEAAYLRGRMAEARHHARAAAKALPEGSPGWLRAEDIASAASAADRERR